MPAGMSHTAESPLEQLIAQFDQAIRRDPARRGLLEHASADNPLCPGHLCAAADHLARFGRSVWLITGFFIPAANPPAAETDGPPGTALLAALLQQLGIPVRLLTDHHCAAAVRCAARLYGLNEASVSECPADRTQVVPWIDSLLSRDETGLTHLVSVERVGPSHTPESIAGRWARDPVDSTQNRFLKRFMSSVAEPQQGRCHNMRGEIIDDVTSPLHRVIERVHQRCPAVKTIGIGDGGNELGMGAIPWSDLASRLTGPAAVLVPCHIPTDWTILAGVSNWGAMALAAAVAVFRQRQELVDRFSQQSEEMTLKAFVSEGPAVDGVTRRPEATVDGLPFLTYIQPWTEILHRIHTLAHPAQTTQTATPHAAELGTPQPRR
jgi:D-glutamate cyclase